jgi:hypothetical protein
MEITGELTLSTPMRRSRRSVILGKIAQIDERLFAQAISLFCYKDIATGAGLIDLIAGTSVLQ